MSNDEFTKLFKYMEEFRGDLRPLGSIAITIMYIYRDISTATHRCS